MTTLELQQFVQQDENLDDLLIKRKLYMNTKFSNARYDNEALKLHIAADYYESFKEIYKNTNGNKKNIVNTLLKSIDFIATSELRQQIIDKHLIPTLETSITILTELKSNINNKNLEPYFASIDEAFSTSIFQIINQFGKDEKIKPYKNTIIETCLDICDIVSKANPSKEVEKYAIYNVMINNIKNIKDFGIHQERFKKHRGSISVKRDNADNKYIAWVIIAIIIFIIRLFIRLA